MQKKKKKIKGKSKYRKTICFSRSPYYASTDAKFTDYDCHLFGIYKGLEYLWQNFLARDRCTRTKHLIWHVWVDLTQWALLCEKPGFVPCIHTCSICIRHISYTGMSNDSNAPRIGNFVTQALCKYLSSQWNKGSLLS